MAIITTTFSAAHVYIPFAATDIKLSPLHCETRFGGVRAAPRQYRAAGLPIKRLDIAAYGNTPMQDTGQKIYAKTMQIIASSEPITLLLLYGHLGRKYLRQRYSQ